MVTRDNVNHLYPNDTLLGVKIVLLIFPLSCQEWSG